MKFYVASVTDVGIKRRENQDALFASTFSNEQRNVAFAVLCDGMGGLSHGAMASNSIVSAFTQWAEEHIPNMNPTELTPESVYSDWDAIVREENDKLRSYGENNGFTMGSTLVVALFTEQSYFIINIGDSRAYFLSPTVQQITMDHSVIAEEVRKGNMSEEQAEQSPIKNVLTRCVGVAKTVQPDLYFGDTEKETVCLICSDGFRHRVTKEEMRETLVLPRAGTFAAIPAKLSTLVDLNKSRGETDNISAIVICATA